MLIEIDASTQIYYDMIISKVIIFQVQSAAKNEHRQLTVPARSRLLNLLIDFPVPLLYHNFR